MSSRSPVATLLTVSLALALPGSAFSQELEEVLVTARKIGESIQDIPLSITAYGAEDIKARQIVDIEDIASFTPGLHMSNHQGARNNPSLKFRGMDNSTTSRDQQLASAFVDGLYLPGSSQAVGMNDIERVEVVKGPQSAFFGRATFGGAVNFITKTPGNDWNGDVQLIAGENGRADFWGSVEGPIVEDKLAFRASGRLYTYDGAWPNAFPGSENLGSQETSAAAITLYATPTDNVSIKFRHSYSEDRDNLGTQWLIKGDPDQKNCGPFFDPATRPDIGRPESYYCGTLTRDLLPTLAIDTSADISNGASWPKSEMGIERFHNISALDINVGIGEYTLSSMTGLVSENLKELRELLSDELLVYLQWEDTSFSQELRLTSPQEERLRWMVGGYYLDLEYGKRTSGFGCPGPPQDNPTSNGPFCNAFITGGTQRGSFGGIFGVGTVLNPNTTITNQALFGSVAYDFTDQLTLSVEVRRAEEEVDTGGTIVQEAPPGQTGAEITLNNTFTNTTPRVILDYKPTDDTTLFVSYSKGNNPGGFNNEVAGMDPGAAAAFGADFGVGISVPEAELDSYEFGVKHSLANGRGFVNAGIYFMEWTNQRFQTFLANVDSNGDGVFDFATDVLGRQIDFSGSGNTDITGLELSAGYALTDNWDVNVSYNYNDTEIKLYRDAVHNRVFGTFDAAGKELARSPKHSGAFSLSFNMPAERGGEWFGRWDSVYQSETYTWVLNLAETEAALLSNVRGGWRNDRYSVTVWVENVTDDDSVLSSRRTTGRFATGQLGWNLSLPEPRQVGVTFNARFGE